jgi:hypothetical protein
LPGDADADVDAEQSGGREFGSDPPASSNQQCPLPTGQLLTEPALNMIRMLIPSAHRQRLELNAMRPVIISNFLSWPQRW